MKENVEGGASLGGAEILEYVGNSGGDTSLMNEGLMRQFEMLPYAIIAISVFLIIIMSFVIIRSYNIKVRSNKKAVKDALRVVDKIRSTDRKIMRANNFMVWVTNAISKTPFTLNNTSREYMDYNLKRADIKIPGGARYMRADEWNAILKFFTIIASVISLVLAILINALFGLIVMTFCIISFSVVPRLWLRGKVKSMDNQIRSNFADYYLMLHYTIIAESNTSLLGVMKSYVKTTESAEMVRYIDTCTHYIDTYGEYEATRHIAREYREINEIGKLMRLIRQVNDGGDVRQELIGFRQELLNEKRRIIEKAMNKLIAKARRSFFIVYIIVFQAIISALSIYVEDLGGGLGSFGL